MENKIDENRELFITILNQITIPGANIEELINWLDNSDFFLAPASTIYHSNYEGGLCQHSLNVYNTMVQLADTFCPGKYEKDSIIIVALLHDLSKVNFYEKSFINKKVYNESGSKHDNMGNFDWVSEEAFKVKDPSERFLLGNHEETSAVLVSRFIPLNEEELVAIMHHHCHTNDGNQDIDQTHLLNKYNLLTLLHTADFISTFILEVK